MNHPTSDQLFDTKAAGEYIDRPAATLSWWRSMGRGPKYLKIGGVVRYRRAHLDQYLDAAVQIPAHSSDATP